ncbi:hypothetical protein EVAR_21168_1 [Eumeta japonica]|uniref:Uncharacterized protein n=1 Tax=Eumeta variegata TaxID=151549 RepID=A0A4C1UNY4_EUMVA|nr:hypothetical protein EVAR_21168_1 [Eumeta japonica]
MTPGRARSGRRASGAGARTSPPTARPPPAPPRAADTRGKHGRRRPRESWIPVVVADGRAWSRRARRRLPAPARARLARSLCPGGACQGRRLSSGIPFPRPPTGIAHTSELLVPSECSNFAAGRGGGGGLDTPPPHPETSSQIPPTLRFSNLLRLAF